MYSLIQSAAKDVKMTTFRKFIGGMLLALLLSLSLTSPVAAKTGSSHHSYSTKSKKSKSTSGKTVHVRSYTKKNGTHVKAYNRRPPNTK
jgi:hypothetical protein